ncbi:12323_t:CDS:1, partial [Gigaspora rosea]
MPVPMRQTCRPLVRNWIGQELIGITINKELFDPMISYQDSKRERDFIT